MEEKESKDRKRWHAEQESRTNKIAETTTETRPLAVLSPSNTIVFVYAILTVPCTPGFFVFLPGTLA